MLRRRSMVRSVRGSEVFEDVGAYVKPPLPELPSVDDIADLERHGLLRASARSHRIVATALRAAGYRAFHESLDGKLEEVLRQTNMREGRLFAPVYAATIALADDPRPLTPFERAATLVFAAKSLCDDVMSGELPADELRGQPLEMGQYPNLFATSLDVAHGRGRLVKSRRFDTVAVIVRRRIYALCIEGGSVAAIARSLESIVADADSRPPVADHESLGILSAGRDATLALARKALDGETALATLRDCFVTLCLDLDDDPTEAGAVAFRVQAANPANRWYLASLQIVVFGNGKAGGICLFPAYLDGNVMMRAGAELKRRADRAAPGGAGASLAPAKSLSAPVPRALANRAWRDVRAVQDHQRATFHLPIGRELFRTREADPVSAFALAVALATKRAGMEIPNILQLVTVSRLRCVPVGGAVVSTDEVRRFVDQVEAHGTKGTPRSMLDAAIASQARETREERSKLSLRWTIEAFLRTRRGAARARAFSVLGVAMAALRASGDLRRDRIILSHPEIYPEVDLLGRPGVRLPYVSHFGLHYQMFATHTIVTFMPGLAWRVPNVLFARAIESALRDLLAIAGG